MTAYDIGGSSGAYRDTTPSRSDPLPVAVRRIAWGAVIAAFAVATLTQICLNLLGLGIGLIVVDPRSSNPLADMGWGAVTWFVISTWIALFVGGMIAGRMAGFPRAMDGFLHGLVTWAVVVLVSLTLATTALGQAMGMTTQLISGSMARGGHPMQTTMAVPTSPQASARWPAYGMPQSAGEIQRPSEEATQQAGQAAIGAFFALILGGLAAAFGGWLGVPRNILAVRPPVTPT